MHAICPKCQKFKNCRSPCYPVKQYLAQDNLSVFEKTITKKNGETVGIVYARSREFQQSMLSIGVDKQGDHRLSNKEQEAFSTDNESPFEDFKPRLKQTGVFIDRFFHGHSYVDIAEKYEMTVKNAYRTYHNALKRILQVLDAMDKGKVPTKQAEYWKRKVEERSGKIAKGQKWFLLNKVFGLSPSEIAELEGLKGSSSVRQLIIRVSDQLRAGEINLIEIKPEDTDSAKARLDIQRKRRRSSYAKGNKQH